MAVEFVREALMHSNVIWKAGYDKGLMEGNSWRPSEDELRSLWAVLGYLQQDFGDACPHSAVAIVSALYRRLNPRAQP